MIDFEKIKAFYRIGKSLSFGDVQVLLQKAQRKTLEQGECLIEEGGTKKEIYFIAKGLVRAFKLNSSGEEVTTSLWWENQVIGNYDIIFFSQSSQFYFEALEKTEILFIDYEVLQHIISRNPKLETHRKFVLHEILRQSIKRIESFVLLSPEERYIEFMKANPKLIHRVPDKHIANILGITPVSLSRIRKRISMKKK
ncbi:MAG: Crp/Fnr family transcriptional regulator [Thermonemataceae bacterium]|nr:Crp/Fnr family transcriptional regulator [Thermonemataceae bacterium]